MNRLNNNIKHNFMRLSSLLSCIVFFALCVAESCGKQPQEQEKPKQESYIRIAPTSKTLDPLAGVFTIFVYSNTEWNVDMNGANWLSPDIRTGKANGKVIFSYPSSTEVAANEIIFKTADGKAEAKLNVERVVAKFKNPIAGVPDPWITKVAGKYWFCKSLGNGVSVSSSSKLTVINPTKRIWSTPKDSGSDKKWNVGELWAPEMHYIDGKWYIYYTAGRPYDEQKNYYKQRCGVLICTDGNPSNGNWKDGGMLYTGDSYYDGIVPKAENSEYAIDLTVCKINGKLYAIWSGGSNGNDAEQALYIAEMSDPTKISSSRVKISAPVESWERVVNSTKIQEGPAALHNQGKTYIVYSTNGSWTKNYRLGWIAINDGDDPMKPASWTKSKEAVFYRCDNSGKSEGVNGVGHCSFTKSPDDSEDWIIYHAKTSSESGWGKRESYAKKFTWNADGSPNFGTPVAYGEYSPLPMGESK